MRPFVTLGVLALITVVLAYMRLAVRVESLETELAGRKGPGGSVIGAQPASHEPPRVVVAPPVIPRAELSELEKSTINLFSSRSKSVVHITTVTLQQDVFRLNAMEVPQGMGSGFMWDTEGH